jgi:toluene monooxygenase electron transfer component
VSDMTFSVKLADSSVEFRCREGDSVLRAGLRAGIGLPYECSAGGCGSCKFELVEGEMTDNWPDAPGIRSKERARGRRLACQSLPTSDCVIKMRPGENFQPKIIPARLVAYLESVEPVTHDIARFRFIGPGAAAFLPGQYALLQLPGTGTLRAYSMSNLANDAGAWEFMIRRTGGEATTQLFDSLKAGDEVYIDGPYGLAYLRDDDPQDMVCIAGGSGLAPVMSIVLGALGSPMRDSRDIHLLYGGRSPADIPSFPEWIASNDDRVRIHCAVSLPELAQQARWEGDVCFVHELLPRKLTQPLNEYTFYLAGPPPMIEAVVRLLVAEHHVPQSQIHYDRFF